MPRAKRQVCSFCGRPSNEVKHIISGGDEGPFICNRCIDSAVKAITNRNKEAAEQGGDDILLKPREIFKILSEHVIGQDRAKRAIAIAVYNHFKRRGVVKDGIAGDIEIDKSNILLMGPSGTGKTHIARSVARMLKLPFYVSDATRMTQAGYVGDDVETMLQGLIQDADGDIERAEWGVIFVDEIDKLTRKSGRGATGYRDVSGEGVQQALLKLVEGGVVPVPRGMGSKIGMGTSDMIDTTNILFICSGSFAGIEEVVGERRNKGARLGFGGGQPNRIKADEVYGNITEDDILDFGLIPELLGRLPVITSTLPLTEDEMVRILTEPKNALVKQFEALFTIDEVALSFDDDALHAIARKACEKPTGARALRGIVEAILEPYMFDAPSDPDMKAIHVTELVVEGAEARIDEAIQQEEKKQAKG